MATPGAQPTPYPDVNAVLSEVLAGVHRILGPRFRGLYLYGSLALGDFTPWRSDVDYVVVTDGDLPDDRVAALAAMHTHLEATHARWGHDLEGSYIPQSALRRHDPAQARYPSIGRGESLRVAQHNSGGVIARYILREHGIIVAGPPIRPGIDPVHPDDLRRDVVAIAREWLVPLPGDPLALDHRGYQAYTVMTLCRMLYTLEYGAIVSKPAAARWAQGALDARWSPLIARALAEDPTGPLDLPDARETIAMIAYTLDRVQADARLHGG